MWPAIAKARTCRHSTKQSNGPLKGENGCGDHIKNFGLLKSRTIRASFAKRMVSNSMPKWSYLCFYETILSGCASKTITISWKLRLMKVKTTTFDAYVRAVFFRWSLHVWDRQKVWDLKMKVTIKPWISPFQHFAYTRVQIAVS